MSASPPPVASMSSASSDTLKDPAKLELENQSLKRRLVQYAATLEKLTGHARREIDASVRARDDALAAAADAAVLREGIADAERKKEEALQKAMELEQKLKEREGKVGELEQRAVTLESASQEREKDALELAELRSEVGAAKREAELARQERKEERERAERLHEEVAELGRQLADTKQVEMKVRDLEVEKEEAEKAMEKAMMELGEMRAKEEGIRSERDLLQKRHQDGDAEVLKLKEELTTSVEKVNELQKAVRSAEGMGVEKLSAAESRAKHAEESVTALRKELDEVHLQLSDTKTALEDARVSSISQEVQKEALEEREALKANLSTIQDELEQSNELLTRAAIDALADKQRIRKLEDSLYKIRTSLNTEREERRMKEQKITQMTASIQNAEHELDDLRTTKRTLSDECHKLQLQIHEQSNAVATKSRELQELGVVRADRESTVQKLELELSNSKNSLAKKESEFVNMAAEYQEVCNQLNQSSKDLESRHVEVATVRRELSTYKDRVVDLETEAERNKLTFSELQAARRQLQEFTEKFSEKESSIAEINRALTAAKNESAGALREKKRLSDMLSDVSGDLKRANQELDILRGLRKDQELLAARISDIGATSSRELDIMKKTQTEQAQALAKNTVEEYQRKLEQVQSTAHRDIADTVTNQLRNDLMPHLLGLVDQKAKTIVRNLAKHVESFAIDVTTDSELSSTKQAGTGAATDATSRSPSQYVENVDSILPQATTRAAASESPSAPHSFPDSSLQGGASEFIDTPFTMREVREEDLAPEPRPVDVQLAVNAEDSPKVELISGDKQDADETVDATGVEVETEERDMQDIFVMMADEPDMEEAPNIIGTMYGVPAGLNDDEEEDYDEGEEYEPDDDAVAGEYQQEFEQYEEREIDITGLAKSTLENDILAPVSGNEPAEDEVAPVEGVASEAVETSKDRENAEKREDLPKDEMSAFTDALKAAEELLAGKDSIPKETRTVGPQTSGDLAESQAEGQHDESLAAEMSSVPGDVKTDELSGPDLEDDPEGRQDDPVGPSISAEEDQLESVGVLDEAEPTEDSDYPGPRESELAEMQNQHHEETAEVLAVEMEPEKSTEIVDSEKEVQTADREMEAESGTFLGGTEKADVESAEMAREGEVIAPMDAMGTAAAAIAVSSFATSIAVSANASTEGETALPTEATVLHSESVENTFEEDESPEEVVLNSEEMAEGSQIQESKEKNAGFDAPTESEVTPERDATSELDEASRSKREDSSDEAGTANLIPTEADFEEGGSVTAESSAVPKDIGEDVEDHAQQLPVVTDSPEEHIASGPTAEANDLPRKVETPKQSDGRETDESDPSIDSGVSPDAVAEPTTATQEPSPTESATKSSSEYNNNEVEATVDEKSPAEKLPVGNVPECQGETRESLTVNHDVLKEAVEQDLCVEETEATTEGVLKAASEDVSGEGMEQVVLQKVASSSTEIVREDPPIGSLGPEGEKAVDSLTPADDGMKAPPAESIVASLSQEIAPRERESCTPVELQESALESQSPLESSSDQISGGTKETGVATELSEVRMTEVTGCGTPSLPAMEPVPSAVPKMSEAEEILQPTHPVAPGKVEESMTSKEGSTAFAVEEESEPTESRMEGTGELGEVTIGTEDTRLLGTESTGTEDTPQAGTATIGTEDTPQLGTATTGTEDTTELGTATTGTEDTPQLGTATTGTEDTPQLGKETPGEADTPHPGDSAIVPVPAGTPELQEHPDFEEMKELFPTEVVTQALASEQAQATETFEDAPLTTEELQGEVQAPSAIQESEAAATTSASPETATSAALNAGLVSGEASELIHRDEVEIQAAAEASTPEAPVESMAASVTEDVLEPPVTNDPTEAASAEEASGTTAVAMQDVEPPVEATVAEVPRVMEAMEKLPEATSSGRLDETSMAEETETPYAVLELEHASEQIAREMSEVAVAVEGGQEAEDPKESETAVSSEEVLEPSPVEEPEVASTEELLATPKEPDVPYAAERVSKEGSLDQTVMPLTSEGPAESEPVEEQIATEELEGVAAREILEGVEREKSSSAEESMGLPGAAVADMKLAPEEVPELSAADEVGEVAQQILVRSIHVTGAVEEVSRAVAIHKPEMAEIEEGSKAVATSEEDCKPSALKQPDPTVAADEGKPESTEMAPGTVQSKESVEADAMPVMRGPATESVYVTSDNAEVENGTTEEVSFVPLDTGADTAQGDEGTSEFIDVAPGAAQDEEETTVTEHVEEALSMAEAEVGATEVSLLPAYTAPVAIGAPAAPSDTVPAEEGTTEEMATIESANKAVDTAISASESVEETFDAANTEEEASSVPADTAPTVDAPAVAIEEASSDVAAAEDGAEEMAASEPVEKTLDTTQAEATSTQDAEGTTEQDAEGTTEMEADAGTTVAVADEGTAEQLADGETIDDAYTEPIVEAPAVTAEEASSDAAAAEEGAEEMVASKSFEGTTEQEAESRPEQEAVATTEEAEEATKQDGEGTTESVADEGMAEQLADEETIDDALKPAEMHVAEGTSLAESAKESLDIVNAEEVPAEVSSVPTDIAPTVKTATPEEASSDAAAAKEGAEEMAGSESVEKLLETTQAEAAIEREAEATTEQEVDATTEQAEAATGQKDKAATDHDESRTEQEDEAITEQTEATAELEADTRITEEVADEGTAEQLAIDETSDAPADAEGASTIESANESLDTANKEGTAQVSFVPADTAPSVEAPAVMPEESSSGTAAAEEGAGGMAASDSVEKTCETTQAEATSEPVEKTCETTQAEATTEQTEATTEQVELTTKQDEATTELEPDGGTTEEAADEGAAEQLADEETIDDAVYTEPIVEAPGVTTEEGGAAAEEGAEEMAAEVVEKSLEKTQAEGTTEQEVDAGTTAEVAYEGTSDQLVGEETIDYAASSAPADVPTAEGKSLDAANAEEGSDVVSSATKDSVALAVEVSAVALESDTAPCEEEIGDSETTSKLADTFPIEEEAPETETTDDVVATAADALSVTGEEVGSQSVTVADKAEEETTKAPMEEVTAEGTSEEVVSSAPAGTVPAADEQTETTVEEASDTLGKSEVGQGKIEIGQGKTEIERVEEETTEETMSSTAAVAVPAAVVEETEEKETGAENSLDVGGEEDFSDGPDIVDENGVNNLPVGVDSPLVTDVNVAADAIAMQSEAMEIAAAAEVVKSVEAGLCIDTGGEEAFMHTETVPKVVAEAVAGIAPGVDVESGVLAARSLAEAVTEGKSLEDVE